MKIDPLQIETTAGTQARLSIKQATIDEYAEDMRNGDVFPAIDVFAEPGSERYILSRGFTRRAAWIEAKPGEPINCVVHEGTITDARLYSAGSNAAHGVRRNAKDIKNAVAMLLKDPELDGFADTVIADHAKCHRTTVAKVREQLIIDGELDKKETRKHVQDGKTVEKPVPKKADKPAVTKETKEPPPATKRSQDDFDRDELLEAITIIRTQVVSGAAAVERFNLAGEIDNIQAAYDWLDELLSSIDEEEPLSEAEKAFIGG